MASQGAAVASSSSEGIGTRLLILLAYPLWGLTQLVERRWSVLFGYLGLAVGAGIAIWVESTWRIRDQVDQNHHLLYLAQLKWWHRFDALLIARPFDGLWQNLYRNPFNPSNGTIFQGYLFLGLLGGFVVLALVCLFRFATQLSQVYLGYPAPKQNLDQLSLASQRQLVPDQLLDARSLLYEAEHAGDPRARRLVVDVGFQLIEQEYGPNPRWPGERVGKRIAQNAWRQQVRGGNHAIADAALHAQTDERIYRLRQRLDELKFQDQEHRRVQMLAHDTDAEVRKAQAAEIARGAAQAYIIQAQAEADIRVYQAKQEIGLALAHGEQDPVAVVTMVNAKIDEIEANPNLSQDQKHRMSSLWREALPQLIEAASHRSQP